MEARIEHVGLGSPDPEALADWYRRCLGFEEIFRSDAEPPVIFLRDRGGSLLEIFPLVAVGRAAVSGAEPREASALHLAFAVEDFEAAEAALEAAGVPFVAEAKEIFAGGRARFFADPEGNRHHIVWRPRLPWRGTR